MGMFDNQDLGEPFADNFKEGEVFTLQGFKAGPMISTGYGDGRPVLLTINGKRYCAFGTALLNQVEDMEDGDLPAAVRMVRRPTKNGQQVKILEPAAGSPASITVPDEDIIPF